MPRELSPQHKAAMERGRKRAAKARDAKRRREAVKKVEAFRAWSKADAQITYRRKMGEPDLPRIPTPEIARDITDADFKIARGEA